MFNVGRIARLLHDLSHCRRCCICCSTIVSWGMAIAYEQGEAQQKAQAVIKKTANLIGNRSGGR